VAHNSAKNSAKPLLETWSWTERILSLPISSRRCPSWALLAWLTPRNECSDMVRIAAQNAVTHPLHLG
jgi:hypothetical protein